MVTDFRNDLLGGRDTALRLPVIGNIRPGIKRLKNGCSDTDKAIYDSMVKQGSMWHEIDQRLGPDKNGKTKLIPGNEDYFTVRPQDCRTNQENAKTLHDLYADSDGHIRRFPIILLSNDWFDCIPHELVCWSARDIKYRSQYKATVNDTTGEQGYERVCVAPVPYVKGVRPFGGRDYREARPCRPKECSEYQKGLCKLRGHVQGIIPGTRGAGVWRIETSSIYSFLQMREQMEMVQRITNRLQGLINEKTGKPVFWLRKATDSISRVDVDKGESTRTEQDLIYLEADIDMYELITAYQPQAVLTRAERATRALTGGVQEDIERTTKGKAECTVAEARLSEAAAEPTPLPPMGPEPKEESAGNSLFPEGQNPEDERPAEQVQLLAINRAASKLGVAKGDIEEYCLGLTYSQASEAIKLLNQHKTEFMTA